MQHADLKEGGNALNLVYGSSLCMQVTVLGTIIFFFDECLPYIEQ